MINFEWVGVAEWKQGNYHLSNMNEYVARTAMSRFQQVSAQEKTRQYVLMDRTRDTP